MRAFFLLPIIVISLFLSSLTSARPTDPLLETSLFKETSGDPNDPFVKAQQGYDIARKDAKAKEQGQPTPSDTKYENLQVVRNGKTTVSTNQTDDQQGGKDAVKQTGKKKGDKVKCPKGPEGKECRKRRREKKKASKAAKDQDKKDKSNDDKNNESNDGKK